MTTSFPNSIWDGTSRSRDNFSVSRGPDNIDYNRISEELIATQTQSADHEDRLDAIEADAWDDLRIDIFTKGGSKDPTFAKFMDDGSASIGVFLNVFGNGPQEDELYFVAQLPHAWKEGTEIRPHVHWSPMVSGGASTQSPVWALEYTVASFNGELFPATVFIENNEHVPDETPIAKQHYFTQLPAISMTGKTISCMLICRLFRNKSGDDDLEQSIALLEFDFHYQVDARGSVQEYVK